jgi:glycerol-3-phosphate acyltransferase PlsX
MDIGANVDCRPQHLFQFGVMASAFSRINDVVDPRVGLLSIGEESGKGNSLIKDTYPLLEKSSLNFIGNVEGRDVFQGDVDDIVCDGFVGNVFLKTTEGVAKMISYYVKQSFNQNKLTRLAALISWPIIKNLRNKIDPRRYNGASLLGLRGIVIKSHGSADELSFSYAIKEAIIEVQKNVPSQISHQLATLLNEKRRVE